MKMEGEIRLGALFSDKVNLQHNHAVDQEEFQLYPSQRRPDQDGVVKVVEMCEYQSDKRVIREKLAEKTGKRVVMKDIHNIAVKAKLLPVNIQENAENLEQWLTETYKYNKIQ